MINLDKRHAYEKKWRDANKEKCHLKTKKWMESHREQYNAIKFIYGDKLKIQTIRHYGEGKIACKHCGMTDIELLTLDHINDDGAAQRREFNEGRSKSAGSHQYAALKKRKFPPGIQILCFNCNWKKEMNRRLAKRMSNPFFKEYYTTQRNVILSNQLQPSTASN